MADEIYVAPGAAAAAVIRFGGICYYRVGPTDVFPDVFSATPFSSCEQCAGWLQALNCADDSPLDMWASNAGPGVHFKKVVGGEVICAYWGDAFYADPGGTVVDASSLEAIDDCEDDECVHYCYLLYEIEYRCFGNQGVFSPFPYAYVVDGSCGNTFGIEESDGWLLWDVQATKCIYRRLIKEGPCDPEDPYSDANCQFDQTRDPGLPDALLLADCTPCPGGPWR